MLNSAVGALLGTVEGNALAPFVGSSVGTDDGVLLLLSDLRVKGFGFTVNGAIDGTSLGCVLVLLSHIQGSLNVYDTLLPLATASGQYDGTNGLSEVAKLDS